MSFTLFDTLYITVPCFLNCKSGFTGTQKGDPYSNVRWLHKRCYKRYQACPSGPGPKEAGVSLNSKLTLVMSAGCDDDSGMFCISNCCGGWNADADDAEATEAVEVGAG